MKDIKAFLAEDHQGHVERSGADLLRHADRENDLTVQERKDYFYGITTVFPIMLLSHYYEGVLGGNVDVYMKQFAPIAEERHASQMKGMLEAVYAEWDNDALWAAAASGYLATYPYELLHEFSAWALTKEEQAKAEEFVRAQRAAALPKLAKRLASCQGSPKARVETIVYLGGDYPFELLGQFHGMVFGG